MDLGIAGRRALVTGSHRGTGEVIARRFAQEQVHVFVHGFEPGQAEPIAEQIPNAIAVTGDITTDSGAAEVAAACLADGAPIDVLVNNYGTARGGSWESAGEDEWLDMYQRNVLSAQRMVRALLPPMREARWGRIINLGTVGSTRPNSRMPHYYAAKAALANLTVSLAKEVAGAGITVNLVSPGLILTPEVESAYLERGRRNGWGATWEEIEPRVAENIPLGRIARREEVADLVVFLASERASFLHGQNIRIDGGSLDIVS
jgi:3-oxoacyl-[acyl-carrier protein] reductase